MKEKNEEENNSSISAGKYRVLSRGYKGYYIKNELSHNLNIPKIGSISPYIGYGKIFNFDIAYTKPDKASGYVSKPEDEV